MKPITINPDLQEGGKRAGVFGRIRRTPSLLAGSVMLAVLALLAVFIPFISPYDPSGQNLSDFCSPRRPSIGWERTNWAAICLRG